MPPLGSPAEELWAAAQEAVALAALRATTSPPSSTPQESRMAYRTRLRTDSVLEITVPPSSTPTIVRVAGSDRTTQTGLVVDAPAEVQLTVASRQQPRVIRSPARQRAAG